MSVTCVTPTFSEVEPTYGIFATDPPPCIPDAVTQTISLETEDLLELLTESNVQLDLEG